MLQRQTDGKRALAIAGSIIAIIGLILLSVDRYTHIRPRFHSISPMEYVGVAAIAGVLALAVLILIVFLLAKIWRIPFIEAFIRSRWMFWPYSLLLYPGWERLFFRSAPLLPFEISTALACIVLIRVIHQYPLPEYTREYFRTGLKKRRYLLLSIMILVVGTAWFAGVFGQRRKPVGDEPSYLMITHSIVSDFDVMLDNDYAAKPYLRFFPGEYPMFTHLGYDGKNYPHHSIGLPLILAPVYALAQHGSDVFLVFSMRFAMLIIYVLLALAILRMIELFGISPGIAFWTTAAGMLSGPMFFYSGEIYPETLAALIFVLAVTFLAHYRGRSRPVQWLATGAGIAFLPWLGIKYIAAAAMLVIISAICLFQESSKGRKSAAFLTVPLISLLLYGIFLYTIYRNINPGVIYTGVHPGTSRQALPPDMPTFWSILPSRLIDMIFFAWGFFLEQRIGLFFLFPASIFAFYGIPTMLKQQRRPGLALLAIIAAHFGIYAWHNNWGGYCPPNRQAISVIPLLLAPLAFGFDRAKHTWPKLLAVLCSLVGWRFTLTLLNNERWLYMTMNPDQIGGGATWFYNWSPLDSNILIKFFPLLMGPEKRWIPSIIWTILFGVLIASISYFRPKHQIKLNDNTGWVIRSAFYGYLCAALVCLVIVIWVPPHTILFQSGVGWIEKVYSIDGSIAGNTGDGFWITGGTEGRLIVSASSSDKRMKYRLKSLTPNQAKIITGKASQEIDLVSDHWAHDSIKIGPWKRWSGKRMALVSVNVKTGIRPFQIDDKIKDNRFLGAYVVFSPEP